MSVPLRRDFITMKRIILSMLMTAKVICAQAQKLNPWGLVYDGALTENVVGEVQIRPVTYMVDDIGILASLDPVALDKACLDLVFNHISTSGDNADPLIQRINRQHGTHTVEYAEQIGLGTQSYSLIDLDSQTGIDDARTTQSERYNVYSLDGKKLLTNAANLDGLTKGTYIINGEKRVLE